MIDVVDAVLIGFVFLLVVLWIWERRQRIYLEKMFQMYYREYLPKKKEEFIGRRRDLEDLRK